MPEYVDIVPDQKGLKRVSLGIFSHDTCRNHRVQIQAWRSQPLRILANYPPVHPFDIISVDP